MGIQGLVTKTICGGKAELRSADKLMRHLRKHLPCAVPTRMYNYNIVQNGNELAKSFVDKKQNLLFSLRFERNGDVENVAKQIYNEIRTQKVANCGELSIMARAGFLANGFKNVRQCVLKVQERFLKDGKVLSENTKNADHAFMVLNLDKNFVPNNPKTYGKNAIIVDLWDGFVDFVQPAFKRYEKYFMPKEGNKVAAYGVKMKRRFLIDEALTKMKNEEAAKLADNFKIDFPDLVLKSKKANS